MAARTTALTEFADNGNSRTYLYAGHTASEPRLVFHTRRVPQGNEKVAIDTLTVLSSTEDANAELLPSRVTMKVEVRRPIDGIAADVTALLAIFRDIIAGDEFAYMVTTQGHPDDGTS